MIQNDEIKNYFNDSESSYNNKNYQLAAHLASTGLTIALNRVKRAVVGYSPSFTKGFLIDDGFGGVYSDREGQDILKSFLRIQDSLFFLSLGMNYSDYLHFRSLAGYVLFLGDGSVRSNGEKDPLDPQETEFVLAFCIDSVLKIESFVGDINTPFGSDHW